MTPKVSVVIPAYNAQQYLGETLDCLAVQTLREIEVLVVDDAPPTARRRSCGNIAKNTPLSGRFVKKTLGLPPRAIGGFRRQQENISTFWIPMT